MDSLLKPGETSDKRWHLVRVNGEIVANAETFRKIVTLQPPLSYAKKGQKTESVAKPSRTLEVLCFTGVATDPTRRRRGYAAAAVGAALELADEEIAKGYRKAQECIVIWLRGQLAAAAGAASSAPIAADCLLRPCGGIPSSMPSVVSTASSRETPSSAECCDETLRRAVIGGGFRGRLPLLALAGTRGECCRLTAATMLLGTEGGVRVPAQCSGASRCSMSEAPGSRSSRLS